MPPREPESSPRRRSLPAVWGALRGHRTIVGNTLYSLAAQVSSGAFTAILTLYLVRALAPRHYGDFALAVGVGALVSTPADMGVTGAAARFAAENQDDPDRLAAFMADALRLKVLTSVIACGALAILAEPIASAYHAPLVWPLRLIALAVLGQNLMFLFEAGFTAVRRTGDYVGVVAGESLTECAVTVAIVLAGAGVTGAAAGRAIGYAFGGVLALRLGARHLGWTSALRRRGRRPLTGRIARYAAPLVLVDGANALFTMVDILLIGAYLGTRPAGLFSAPVRLLALSNYLGIAVAAGVAPRMAQRAGRHPDGVALAGGIRLLIVLYGAFLAPMVIWPRPIVSVALGAGYEGSASTVRVLALSMLLGGMAPLVSVSATYLGDAGRRVPLMIGATLADIVIDVILIPRIGIVSGAIATAVAYAIMFAGHLWICMRHVALPLRALGRTVWRACLAVVAMGCVLLASGPDPSPPVLILGAVAGLLVYVAVLVVTGELSRGEITRVWLWTRSRRPSAPTGDEMG